MNEVKPACDLQSLSRNVIMLVLFTAAVIVFIVPFLVPVQWFLARKSYISLEGEGKLALFRTELTMFYLPILPATAAATAGAPPSPHYAQTHDKKFFQGKFNH